MWTKRRAYQEIQFVHPSKNVAVEDVVLGNVYQQYVYEKHPWLYKEVVLLVMWKEIVVVQPMALITGFFDNDGIYNDKFVDIRYYLGLS